MLPLTDKDISLAAELYGGSFSRAWSEEEIYKLTRLPGFIGYICKDGMIILNIVADEAEIYTICVRPERRGEGLGKQLLKEGISRALEKGAKKIFLEVAVDNRIAINLYESFGFIKAGIRKKYYNNTTDALILAKEFL